MSVLRNQYPPFGGNTGGLLFDADSCGSVIGVFEEEAGRRLPRVFNCGIAVRHGGSLEDSVAKQLSDHRQQSKKHQTSRNDKDQYNCNQNMRHR